MFLRSLIDFTDELVFGISCIFKSNHKFFVFNFDINFLPYFEKKFNQIISDSEASYFGGRKLNYFFNNFCICCIAGNKNVSHIYLFISSESLPKSPFVFFGTYINSPVFGFLALSSQVSP